MGNEYSIKTTADNYDEIRVIGFKTEQDAKEYAIKQMKDYKKWLNKEVDEMIKTYDPL